MNIFQEETVVLESWATKTSTFWTNVYLGCVLTQGILKQPTRKHLLQMIDNINIFHL